jgi:bifunctional non-homologous end joining protein LigD
MGIISVSSEQEEISCHKSRLVIENQPAHSCPFVNLPNSTGKGHWGEGITESDMAALRWVKPVQVVEVEFVEWTAEALLRHSRFVGVRDDKRASAIRRE